MPLVEEYRNLATHSMCIGSMFQIQFHISLGGHVCGFSHMTSHKAL